jgi:hypothetical protein
VSLSTKAMIFVIYFLISYICGCVYIYIYILLINKYHFVCGLFINFAFFFFFFFFM